MKNYLSIIGLGLSLSVFSQVNIDSLKESIDDHKMKLVGVEERVNTMESDLSKLSKIKFSGYIQAQYEYYDASPKKVPSNTFFIRRARLKATYEAADGVKFVLQPDFSTNNLSLKDAYAVINDKWTKIFSLWAGQFNRLNYEVEYSSSQREVLERSRVIKALYPGEREIGVKLVAKPKNVPLKFELAAFNGNFTGTQAKDVDNQKDIMARASYSIALKQIGMGIDLGAHTYYGTVQSKDSKYVLNSQNKLDSLTIGDLLPRQWYGAEVQLYWDFLGGMSIKAEYLAGMNSTLGTATTNVTQSGGTATTTNSNGSITTSTTGQTSTTKKVVTANTTKEFSGYYVYLIKNIGKKNQFVAKYDNFDPNTKLSGNDAKTDLYYNTLTLGLQHYYDDNIRLSFCYEMPMNEKNDNFKNDILDNTISIRIQAKF